MQNKTAIDLIRGALKEKLALCTEPQHLMFKRMYSHKTLDLPINEVVDNMPVDKLDWALSQVERTVENNIKKAIQPE